MVPMLVLPLVNGPRDEGSGSSALRNSIGMISRPWNIIGSIEVIPMFSSTSRCFR